MSGAMPGAFPWASSGAISRVMWRTTWPAWRRIATILSADQGCDACSWVSASRPSSPSTGVTLIPSPPFDLDRCAPVVVVFVEVVDPAWDHHHRVIDVDKQLTAGPRHDFADQRLLIIWRCRGRGIEGI